MFISKWSDTPPTAFGCAAASGNGEMPTVIVLANRAPVQHQATSEIGSWCRVRSASGLVSAIEPLVLATSGTWVAHGDDADMRATGAAGHVIVRSDNSHYRLRYVGVDHPGYQGFYAGFSNEALWPMCHATPVLPIFRSEDFAHYQAVNRRFAAAVAAEGAGKAPVVLVQDYHFALAPRWIRRWLPDSPVVSFWHIPWPRLDVFRRCPWSRQLLRGLLGSDVVGLQTQQDCGHFLDGASSLLRLRVDRERGIVRYRGRRVHVRAYPVGVEWNSSALRTVPPAVNCREWLHREHQLPERASIVVGVDRMDYTKGLAAKFAVIERLLERRPDLVNRLVLLQVAEPSRQTLQAYRDAREEAVAVANRVNARHGNHEYRPIVLLERHHDTNEVCRLYRGADVCYVNSFGDGMNLVGKEFVAARDDERGALLLSEFAGASRQLSAALLVNPYQVEHSARTLEHALHMPAAEQLRRMRAMRRVVASTDTSWWAGQLLRDALVVRAGLPGAIAPRLKDTRRRLHFEVA